MDQNCRPLPADQSGGFRCAIPCPWVWILGLAVAALMILYAWQTAPAEYSARVILRFAEEPTDESEHFQNDRKLQPSVIRSPIVLRSALQKPGIAQLNCLKDQEDKERWLSDHLSFMWTGADFLTISISGPEKDELVELLTAVHDAYMEEIVQVERDLDIVKRDELSRERQNLGNALPYMETECQNLEKANAAGEETPDLERLQKELARKKAEYEQMGAQLRELELKIQAPLPVQTIGEPCVKIRKKTGNWFPFQSKFSESEP